MSMNQRLLNIAQKIWTNLQNPTRLRCKKTKGNAFGVLYSLPLAVLGIIWLVSATDLALLYAKLPVLLLLFSLFFILEQLNFHFFAEITPGIYSDWQTSLMTVIIWSAVLLFGPTALWINLLYMLSFYARWWWKAAPSDSNWCIARNCSINIVDTVFVNMVALYFYELWGGVYPFSGLTRAAIIPALLATLVEIVLSALIWVPFLINSSIANKEVITSPIVFSRFWLLSMGSRMLIDPFAILAAGLYAQNGLGGYLFFVAGLLLTSLLAHQLSLAATRSQLRSRELERLERLGRALIYAPPDISNLPELLKEHISNMFPESFVEICIFPDRVIHHHPEDHVPITRSAWKWLRGTTEAHYFPLEATLPWNNQQVTDAVIIAPIIEFDTAKPIGGIYLARGWDVQAIADLLPAVQTLAAQIGAALYSVKSYEQMLAHQRVEYELTIAGKIQADFLPKDLPRIEGWQMTATLHPAKQTSGDFYDFIPLPGNRLGILIADVADKGMGAALYMASIRSIIRTYATEYTTQPRQVLRAANRRILADTRTSMFTTVFYGILNPAKSSLVYCNAGHIPPYLFSNHPLREFRTLPRTGMPLGILQGVSWEEKCVQFTSGDVLMLYTDGITDAENNMGDFFGRERLLKTAQSNLNHSAQKLQNAIVQQVREFIGDAPQFDDITLMIIARERSK